MVGLHLVHLPHSLSLSLTQVRQMVRKARIVQKATLFASLQAFYFGVRRYWGYALATGTGAQGVDYRLENPPDTSGLKLASRYTT